ncbi:hypothetical protein [Nocardioides sp. zg-1230]|uniref:hypothetical protein n=1 Tax=Nocardioides sp. zg-1230 TaxID=2736601 RepID=UPI001557D038|nr:hypothetical protein [Nocardioides sp. zg-1230]NPC42937.1 hypothetical protein [Nocardioides sp. zg-1230]
MVNSKRLGTPLLVLAAGVFVLAFPAPPAVAASDSPVCPVAEDLTDAHHPQKALALIAAARDDAALPAICGPEESAAAEKVAEAATLVPAATKAETDAKDLDGADEAALVEGWRAALTAANAVLAIDADNVEAQGIRDRADTHIPKAAEQAVDSNAFTRVDADESEWKKFKKSVVDPLSTLLLAGLAVVLGIAVAARLLLLLWSGTWPRFTLKALTMLSVAGAVTAIVALASPWWLDSAKPWLVGWTIAIYAASAVSWAIVLGSRMRLTVQVRDAAGKEDEGAATQLIAMLRELGGDPPAGLEVPRGTDVDVLNGKAITDVKNGWLAAALTAMQVLLGVTPWRVVVDLRQSGEAHAVMTRNGRNVGSAVLEKCPLGSAGPSVDTVDMAAAFVLLRLSDGYGSGFDGLVGAQDWRSVGWQYAATTGDFKKDQKIDLLSHAIDVDPENLAAQIAFRHELDRSSADDAVLERYVAWLYARVVEPKNAGTKCRPIRVRLLHTATAVTLNRRHQLAGEQKDQARRCGKELAGLLLAEVAELSVEDPFGRSLRPVAKVLHGIAYGYVPDAVVTSALGSTTLDYDLACLYAEQGDTKEAINRLAPVMAGTGGRDEVSSDPFLIDLAKSTEFLTRYPGTPRSDMLDVDPFKPHAYRLRAAGLTTPRSLVALSISQLATIGDVRTYVLVRRLRGLAEILVHAPSGTAKLKYEVIEVLYEHGIRSGRDLERQAVHVATIAAALRKRALLLDESGRRLIFDWLQSAAR